MSAEALTTNLLLKKYTNFFKKEYIKIPKIFSITLLKTVNLVLEFLPLMGSINNTPLHHVCIISCDSPTHRTPPPTPPRLRGGETKRSFGGVGFLEINK
ncbi:hypothetical protein NIES4070_12780 [Nostoc commune HK-02]|nr:hypothetical protein NIES4070_12780 [Nostoc commune HK-02]